MAKRTPAQRRQEMFDLYAANASFYLNNTNGRFYCPICANPFGPEALRPESLAVDIAHVYPKSCGFNLETLTCQACNNRMGRRFDHQIAREHQVWRAMDGGKLNTRLKFEGGSVGVEFTRFRDGSVHFNVIAAQTNPAEQQALIRSFEQPGVRFSFDYQWISTAHHNVAILASAYLALFREYGYEYAALAQTAALRRVLCSETPPEEPMFSNMIVPPDARVTRDSLFATGVATIGGARCLVVLLPTPNPRAVARAIFLPGFGQEGEDEYAGVRERAVGRVTVNFNLSHGGSATALKDRLGVFHLRHLWNNPPER